MRQTFLAVFILCVLFSGPLAGTQSTETIPQMERHIFDLANQERLKAGAPPLKWSNNLAIAARLHSDEMVKHKELSHQFKGEPELGARLADQGASFDANAENVGYADSPEELHSGWMHSPPHRANLLNPRYDQMGVGIARAGDRLYATEDFMHSVAKYSGSQAQDEIAAAYRKFRQSRRLPLLHVNNASSLQELACADQASAQIPVPRDAGNAGQRYVVNYTTSDLSSFPSNLVNQLTNPNLKTVDVGVCARHDVAHGFSGYRVIAVLY